MDKIINLEDARKAAHKLTQPIEEQEKEKANIFESLMEEIQDVNPALGGMDELAMILSLPEEHFSQIAPVFLDELEKSFNNINDKMLMVEAMNTAGLKMEDVQDEYFQIAQQIDEQMEGTLSVQKRDFLKRLLGITYNTVSDAHGVAKKTLLIPIEYCHEDAHMPTYANVTDAGMDIYALEDITIAPGETKLIKTGIKVALPLGYELQVRPKSGRSLKTKLRVANTPGTIDSGYRDEIGVIIENVEPPIKDIQYDFIYGESDHEPDYCRIRSILYGSNYTIGKGEKFAQLVLSEVPKASFYEVDSVANIGDNRGGGFGSTGLK